MGSINSSIEIWCHGHPKGRSSEINKRQANGTRKDRSKYIYKYLGVLVDNEFPFLEEQEARLTQTNKQP